MLKRRMQIREQAQQADDSRLQARMRVEVSVARQGVATFRFEKPVLAVV